MVHSFSLPLKPSDEAIVKFLMGLVFGSQKKLMNMQNRRECLRHDVIAANKLIFWILENDKKNRKSFSSVCNLVYGNTLVLGSQVARLLFDAIRAKEMVSFSSFIEDERKRRTREQMEKAIHDEEYTTPKKKRRSKALDDDYLIASPVMIRQALLQNITMPDVVTTQKEVNFFPDDDLAPVTEQQFEMLYGLLEETDRSSSINQKSNSVFDKTFIDRYSSEESCRKTIYADMDIELQRPSDEFIQEQQQTPRKPTPSEDIFEPAPHLAEILMYGRLPILGEEERRKSLEDEMEDARNHAINSEFEVTEQRNVDMQNDMDYQQDLNFVRIPSEIQLENIVEFPKTPTKTPRSATRNRKGSNFDEMGGINNRVPLRDMHRRMEDFSALHYSDATPLLYKHRTGMTVQELLNPVPYQFREKANKMLWEPFRVFPKKHQVGLATDLSDDEENESTSNKNRPPDFDMEQLDPIDLSQMKIMATPLKEKTPCTSPQRLTELEMREEIEYPRRNEESFDKLLTATPQDPSAKTPVPFEEYDFPPREFARTPMSSHSEDVTSAALIRKKLLEECKKDSPFTFHLDSAISINATRREAARTFYVVLELLKERKIVAKQQEPFEPIELMISITDSDDIEDIIEE